MAKKLTSRAYLVLLAIALFSSFAYFAFAAPAQTGTYWRDNFTDTAGISALSKMNFSTGSFSLSNALWF